MAQIPNIYVQGHRPAAEQVGELVDSLGWTDGHEVDNVFLISAIMKLGNLVILLDSQLQEQISGTGN